MTDDSYYPDKSVREFLSDSSHRLVDIVFAVVVGQSVTQYSDLLFPPAVSLPWVALFFVYAAIVLSWIGYHYRMYQYPYQIRNTWSKFRFTTDLAIVVMYSYLLLTVEWIQEPNQMPASLFPNVATPSTTAYLGGFIAVFILYLTNDVLIGQEDHERETGGGAKSIHRKPNLVVISVLFLFGILTYAATRPIINIPILTMYPDWSVVFFSGGIMWLWRWVIGKDREEED